ncbi:MAG: glycosyltransferase family 2 protein [Chloroflexi bacterium]|nr:glycosyltransferase family 2 protein [Chloroflexota bacterium]
MLIAVVLTLNEQRHIADCLASLAWADGRLVFDSFSSDRTVALAQAAGADVAQLRFENYAQQRNAALEHVAAQHADAWVFFVDADERCTPALAAEIRAVVADPRTDERPVWSVPRNNYLFGRLTKGAGWWPDFQARLFRVGRVRFDPLREVHEVALFDGEHGFLKNELTHFNYDDVAQFHAKQRRYTEYDASILFKQNIRPKPRNFVLQPLREFKRRFFALRGYVDGLHGLRLSLLMAYYQFDLYRRLARMWRERELAG